MLIRILTLLVLLFFAWWSLRRYLHQHKIRQRGEPEPQPRQQERRVRPITWLCAALAVFYIGYLLIYLLTGRDPPL